MSLFDQTKISIPSGERGVYKVERFTVAKSSPFNVYYAAHGRPVPPGEYTRLCRNGKVIMSDTPAEIRDHFEIIHRATGRVLINGLGLGVVLRAILYKPEIIHVDVVEVSEDIIHLVAPSYLDPRVKIHHNDAFAIQWPKGEPRWNVVWHDIWDDICVDNLAEMAILHRKYGRRCDWQGSWSKELCKRLRQRKI